MSTGSYTRHNLPRPSLHRALGYDKNTNSSSQTSSSASKNDRQIPAQVSPIINAEHNPMRKSYRDAYMQNLPPITSAPANPHASHVLQIIPSTLGDNLVPNNSCADITAGVSPSPINSNAIPFTSIASPTSPLLSEDLSPTNSCSINPCSNQMQSSQNPSQTPNQQISSSLISQPPTEPFSSTQGGAVFSFPVIPFDPSKLATFSNPFSSA